MHTRGVAVALVVIITVSTIGLGAQNTSVVEAQTSPEIIVDDTTVDVDETDTVGVTLSSAPNGLTGYLITISLDNPDTANITGASIPDVYSPPPLQAVTIAEDNNSVTLKATDATNAITAGAQDVPLGSIEVTGENPGQTDVSVSVDLMQDDRNPPELISPSVDAGSITVEGENQPPTADAGEDQTADEGTTVQLDASDSSDPDGDALSYAWTQTDSTGIDVALSGADTATPSFTAPDVDSPTDLTFEVEVDDSNGEVDTDTVSVTVDPVNQPPTADAGDDQTVDEGTTVDLDASRSSDPDGDTLSYTWTQMDGPDVTLSGADMATPSLTAPDVDSSTDLTFEVEVDDGNGGTDTDSVTVTVDPVNQPPTADAGDDQMVDEGTSVDLDAGGSSDPDGDTLSYTWTQTDSTGLDVTLTGADTATPSFTAPDVDSATDFTFEVEVDDGNGGTDADTVAVTVRPAPSGGGGDDPNAPPTADAGEDQTVDEGVTVDLDASDSSDPDGDTLSYAWTQTDSTGLGVTLTDGDTATPSFTAPDVDSPTDLTFEVEVSDGNGGTDTDSVAVTVDPVNQPPTADAGDDQTVDEGRDVSLDATGSSDPDGDTLSYTWTQTDGLGVTLSDGDTETPSFTAPDVDSPTDLTFEVEVSDGNGGTDTDSVTVTVNPVEEPIENQPPTADAGEDQTVDEGTAVDLDATGSSDPDGDSLSYTWTQTDTTGTAVTLSGADTATPSFTAPSVDSPTELTFEVEVDDGNGGTDTDTVTVTVDPVEEPIENQPPTADAGEDQTVDEGTTVNLDATGSSDPDGDALSYMWMQTAGPDVTFTGADTATPSFTAPDVDSPTDLTFEVEVNDGNGGTDTETVNVTVQNVTEPEPPESENRPPTADAGDDQTVDEGSTVQLDASGSTDPDGDIVTHNWTQTDGPTVTLSSQFADEPTFTAPAVDTQTTLTFVVEARDGNGGVDTDTVDVTVVPTNDPPTADAGDDQTVDEEITVQLDGMDSTDPNDDDLTYAWRQVGGAGVTLSDAETATPSFTAPTVDSASVLTFEVEVSDGNGGTDTDVVNVTVNPVEEPVEEPGEEPAENQPPTADAGTDQTVSAESDVELDAGGSTDPDGDTLSYTWSQSDGPSVALVDPSAAAPSFTAPDVDSSTDLTFEVEVSDGNGGTDTDTVTVTVEPVSEGTAFFSVTNLDAPDEVTQGEQLTLSGTVTNTGDAEGTQTVDVRVDFDRDGTLETLRSRSITLASGESETFTATRTVPEDLPPGTYDGGLFTADSEQTTSVEVVASEEEEQPEQEPETEYTRDEISQAKYGYDFDELSTETARQVEELYLRQPFADGQGPADVKTREELANDRYGEDFDDLSRETTIELQAEFDAQFGDTGADAAYTRDDISQAKYGYDFDELSTETAGQVEELYNRQPFAGDLTPSEVRTREEIAEAEYGDELDDLGREEQIAVERAYHEQFDEASEDA